jgi:hypothetical protein
MNEMKLLNTIHREKDKAKTIEKDKKNNRCVSTRMLCAQQTFSCMDIISGDRWNPS